MNMFFIIATCAYMWPNADAATNEMCYALVSMSDESELTHVATMGRLFLIRPVPDHLPLPRRKRPSPLKIFYNSRNP